MSGNFGVILELPRVITYSTDPKYQGIEISFHVCSCVKLHSEMTLPFSPDLTENKEVAFDLAGIMATELDTYDQ